MINDDYNYPRSQGGNKGSYHTEFSGINVVLIIVTIVAAILARILGGFFYNVTLNTLPRPILIGFIFIFLYLILMIAIHALSLIQDIFDSDSEWLTIAILAGGMVAVFGLASLFQFLYQLDPTQTAVGPTSYIFVIDDSGSTSTTDPSGLRYSAVEEVLKGVDDNFPYAVYSFSDTTSIVREMAPKSQGTGNLVPYNGGGTYIKLALETVFADYESGTWDGGTAPRVILLSDGIASDIGFFSPIKGVLKDYVRAGISISTVGLEGGDNDLMRQIAETTGGSFIPVADANQLASAMTTAAVTSSQRDLVSERYTPGRDLLLGFLRVLFLTILGALIGLMATFAYGSDDSRMLMLIQSAICSLVGALIMEIGVGLLHMPSTITWFILWILLGVKLALKKVVFGNFSKVQLGGDKIY